MADRLCRRDELRASKPTAALRARRLDLRNRASGCGKHLLLDALHRSLAHADQTAAMAVVVDASAEAAAAFYRHYGIATRQAPPSRLFLPIRQVAQMLG
jgi:hypothetical protein